VLKYIAICLLTFITTRFFHLCACFTCLSAHVSTLHLLLAHHHPCYVDVLCFFILFSFCTLWLFFCFVFYLSSYE